MRLYTILTVLLVFFSNGLAIAEIPADLLPQGSRTDQIIHHENYTLGYDEESEQAEWVIYEFTDEEANSPIKVERTDDFRPDPLVNSGSAKLSDYRGSGYDRGHLAPAADMVFSPTAMSESFYMSNMSPQEPGFNRGCWKNLESQVRSWAHNEDLIIVTGGILNGSKRIGNDVLVPDSYYKIIYSPERHKMIAFLLPNHACTHKLSNYIVSVDEVEQAAGIDVFQHVSEEEVMESSSDQTAWPMSVVSTVQHNTKRKKQTQSSTAIVKMSKSGICHDTSSKYYSRTKNYIPFNTLQECLDAGGRLPKR